MLDRTDPTAAWALLATAAATMFGDYAIIVLAAVFGAFVSASRETFLPPGREKTEAAWFIFRAVSIATFTTAPAAYWLEENFKFPFSQWLGMVSFLIALVGDQWFKIKDRLVALGIAALARITK